MSNNRETVKVVVRSRPMNAKELTRCSKNIIGMDLDLSSVTISNPHAPDSSTGATGPSGTKTFTFDSVYDHESSQKAVYQETAYPLVESVLQGYNGTIFAYGQTGCGKTHTMQGPSGDPGVIPQSFDHVFDHIKATPGAEFLVRASYIEIYNEQVRDLLGKDPRKKLDIKEDPSRGVYVKGATQEVVDNASAIAGVMEKGFTNRSVGATDMNKESSRSHSIFTMIIECSEDDEAGQQHFRAGKLNLVDLAGSERQSKTGATGDRLKEGCKINLSLSALGNVISSLVDGGRHIPYRDSKLTRLLQDSLGGNTRTVMVAAISPADYNYDETLSTLRYANRAKNIKNKPKINEDPKDALLRQYKEEIEKLRLMLEQARGAGGALEGMPAPALRTGGGQGASLQAQQAELQGMIQAQQQAAMQAATGTAGASATHGSRPDLPPPAEQGEHGAGGTGPGTNGGVESARPSGPQASEQDSSEQPQSQPEQEQEPRTVTKTVVKEVVKEVPVVKKVVKEVVKEVPREEGAVPEDLSRRHEAQKRALQGLTEAVTEQRNSLGQRLEQTEAQALQSKAEADALAERLAALQSMVISSASSLQKRQKKRKSGEGPEEEDPEVALARQQDEYRRTQHKLRQQRKREARLKKEKERMEAERQQAEGEYRTAQEELEGKYRSVKHQLKKLSSKHEGVLEELEDTRREAAQEKEQLLDAIREQNREVRLFEQLANMFLTPSELGKVWERAEWDEDRDMWHLPRIRPRKDFTPLQLPELGTPSLGGGGGRSPAQGGACVEEDDSTRSAQPPSRAQRGRRQAPPGSAGREQGGRPPLSAGSSRHAQASRAVATGPSYADASPRAGSGISSGASRDHRGASASRAPSRTRRRRDGSGESRRERHGSGRRSRNGVGPGPSGDEARGGAGAGREGGGVEEEEGEEEEEEEESAALETGPETEEQQQARKERRRARRREREEKRRRKEAKRRKKEAEAAAAAVGGESGSADLPALSPGAGEGSESGLGQSAFQVTATSDFGALDAQRDEMEGETRASGRPGTRGRSSRRSGGQGSRDRTGDRLSPVTEADSGMRPPLAPATDGAPPVEGNGEGAAPAQSRQRSKTRRGRRRGGESVEREGGEGVEEESEEARRRRRERHRQKKSAKRREREAAEAVAEAAPPTEQQQL